MNVVILRALFALLASAFFIPGYAKAPPKISQIRDMKIENGINKIKNFYENRDAIIVSGYFDNGNSHGHNTYMTMLKNYDGSIYNIVQFKHDEGKRLSFLDIVQDEPFDGERVIDSVMFARAKVDGKESIIVIDARKDWNFQDKDWNFSEEARIIFKIYQFQGSDTESVAFFSLIEKFETKTSYDSADQALSEEFRLSRR